MSIAIASGARGNITQLKNAVGMLGVQQDAGGNVMELPVKSDYIQGLNPLEYFTATRGTRKSLIDIALKTADSGYLTRRLVDVAQDVFTVDDESRATRLCDVARRLRRNRRTTMARAWKAASPPKHVKGYVKKGQLITPEAAARSKPTTSSTASRS